MFTFILWLTIQNAWADNGIILAVGQTTTISAAPEATVRIKGKKFILVTESGPQLKLTGLAEGNATVTVGTKPYEIYVTKSQQKELLLALSEKAKDFMGPEVEVISGAIIVTGHIHRFSDWQALAEIAETFDGQYLMRAKLDSDVQSLALEFFRRQFVRQNIVTPYILWSPEVKAHFASAPNPAGGVVDSILKPYGVKPVYEKSQIVIAPLVRVKIVVAEVNKIAGQSLGISWPTSTSAQLAPKFKGPLSLDVALQALETEGLGQILAQPNLLARSGSEADFLAGGEFPIRIITPKRQDVEWKRHGIFLKIKPLADHTGHISIELTTEVSLMDMAAQVDGIPSLKTNRMSTHFDLAEPRTIVLSGLLRKDWGHGAEGLPYLMKIPVLGQLFSSKNFMQQESELIIFVTPEIVNIEGEKPPQLPKVSREY